MCGIVGYISKQNYSSQLERSKLLLKHRGPDGNGSLNKQFGINWVGIGHTRLQVVDTDILSNQPFSSKDRKISVVFNGEIYNYEKLRDLLPDFEWQTNSDTEVVVELISHFGTDIVKSFNGIFAIAVLNLKHGTLKLIRDPLGVKPLYYYATEDELFFSSEISALEPFNVKFDVSKSDLFESFQFGYVHEPNTGFENIKKVSPGQVIDCSNANDGNVTLSWGDKTFEDCSNFGNVFERQSNAAVDVGVFFSAGLDSTAIAAGVKSSLLYANNSNDFDTIESKRAISISKFLERKIDVVRSSQNYQPEIFFKCVEEMVDVLEEPISDLTFVPSLELSSMARQQGYTVMLSGMGADEIFGGYLRYRVFKNKRLFKILFAVISNLDRFIVLGPAHKIDRIKNFLSESNLFRAYARLVGYFSSYELQKLFGENNYKELDTQFLGKFENLCQPIGNYYDNELQTVRYLELKGFLSHNLIVADKSSMRHSIELRVPFLDLALVKYWIGDMSFSKNFSNLGKAPIRKYLKRFPLLYSKLEKYFKTGFNPPIDKSLNWLNIDNAKDIIISEKMLKYVDCEGLNLIIDNCFASQRINYHKLWQLIFISKWISRWG